MCQVQLRVTLDLCIRIPWRRKTALGQTSGPSATTRHPALLAKKGKQNRNRRSCSGTSATLSVSILLPSAISSAMLRAPWQCGTSSFSTGDPAASMASSSVSQSPMCHCLVLEIIQFLGTVETPCLQDPSDTSPLLISPLFELAKLTDTAEVVACCAAFLSSFREASSEDIKIIKGRKTSMISSWLAVWEAESRQTKLQRNLCNFICLHSASFGNFQRNVGGTVAVWHLQFLHWRSCNLHGIAFSESISHMSLLGP